MHLDGKTSARVVSRSAIRTCFAPISWTVVQVVHRKTGVSGQTEMIHGQRAERFDGFLILRCRFPGMRRNFVNAVRDEEDQVDEQSIGGSCKMKGVSQVLARRAKHGPLISKFRKRQFARNRSRLSSMMSGLEGSSTRSKAYK